LVSHVRQTGLLAAVGRDDEYLLKIFDLVTFLRFNLNVSLAKLAPIDHD
jgi:hypothetical protein